MSPIVEFTLEQAEGEAAELQAQIGEHERFLADADQLLDEAVTGDVRAGKESKRTVDLRRRKATAEAELPELRRRYRAVSVVADEERAKVAEQETQRRLAELQKYVAAEVEAFEAFGREFEELWPLYLRVREAVVGTHEQWRSLVGGDVCRLHPLDPLPASFASLVKWASIALTLGDDYASSNPFGRFVRFADRDHQLVLGSGADTR